MANFHICRKCSKHTNQPEKCLLPAEYSHFQSCKNADQILAGLNNVHKQATLCDTVSMSIFSQRLTVYNSSFTSHTKCYYFFNWSNIYLYICENNINTTLFLSSFILHFAQFSLYNITLTETHFIVANIHSRTEKVIHYSLALRLSVCVCTDQD
jgi:hypothetical protein